MENLDKNRVPKAWVGREVVVKTLSTGVHEAMIDRVEGPPPGDRPLRPTSVRFGKLEDVHEGGIVLSRLGPTPEVAELGPVLFYPWSSIEELRLKVAPPHGRRETREGPHAYHPEAVGLSRQFESINALTLDRVVPIAQQSSAAGITIALSALEIHEGGRGLIGYLLSPDSELRDWDRLVRYSFPEVQVRDNLGRSYEADAWRVTRAWGGTLRLAGLPEAGAAELEVEVVRLFKGPSGEGRSESLDGPWVFRFPL